MHRNMGIFLQFLWNYGYLESLKTLDFSAFYFSFWLYIPILQKKGWVGLASGLKSKGGGVWGGNTL
jgi:hypothetical protein